MNKEQSILRTSRKMSHALRHSPETYKFNMDSFGVVSIEEICDTFSITNQELLFIVEQDDKGRFGLANTEAGLPGVFARQGHSFPVKIKKLPLSVSVAFHGTQTTNLDSIFSNGIVSKSREFVHMSKDVDTATIVGERRKGNLVILEIDVSAMVSDGLEVFESENGVVLSRSVPAEYISVLKF